MGSEQADTQLAKMSFEQNPVRSLRMVSFGESISQVTFFFNFQFRKKKKKLISFVHQYTAVGVQGTSSYSCRIRSSCIAPLVRSSAAVKLLQYGNGRHGGHAPLLLSADAFNLHNAPRKSSSHELLRDLRR